MYQCAPSAPRIQARRVENGPPGQRRVAASLPAGDLLRTSLPAAERVHAWMRRPGRRPILPGNPTGSGPSGATLLQGCSINGDGFGPLDSQRLYGPGVPPVPGAPARRWRRAGRHPPLTAAGARQPRTARQPGARSSRPAARRRPDRRRAGAATEPPRRTCTARPPCARRTSGSPVRPAPHRPWSSGPAPARPRPARSGASRPAWCAHRTDGAAAHVAPSRRTSLRNQSCHACGPYKHFPCPTDSMRSIGGGAPAHPVVRIGAFRACRSTGGRVWHDRRVR